MLPQKVNRIKAYLVPPLFIRDRDCLVTKPSRINRIMKSCLCEKVSSGATFTSTQRQWILEYHSYEPVRELLKKPLARPEETGIPQDLALEAGQAELHSPMKQWSSVAVFTWTLDEVKGRNPWLVHAVQSGGSFACSPRG